MDHQKEIFPASSSQQIKERKDDRHRSDWQTLVIVTKLGGLVLSLLFHYVKVTQTDYRSYTIQAENDHTRDMVHSQTITDHCRKHTKTYHITQGIDLNSKFLLILCTVLLCTGDFPVKHITKSGQCQTQNCNFEVSLQCSCHSKYGNSETDVCKHHRIIIKSKHILFLLFQTFFLHCS